MDNKKSQFTPLAYILIGIVLVLGYLYLFPNNPIRSSPVFQQSSPTVNPYEDCITWQEAGYHDGESVCIIGNVILVSKEYDEPSGYIIWNAYFSMTENSLRLVSVGDSLDEWQGKCIVVRGTLTDRSKQEPEFRTSPVMLNTDENSDYIIREAPSGLCK
jgi:hypothetical protein